MGITISPDIRSLLGEDVTNVLMFSRCLTLLSAELMPVKCFISGLVVNVYAETHFSALVQATWFHKAHVMLCPSNFHGDRYPRCYVAMVLV